jgi:hypothetical protein
VFYDETPIERVSLSFSGRVKRESGGQSFNTAGRTPEGVEAMNVIRKGQVERMSGLDARGVRVMAQK